MKKATIKEVLVEFQLLVFLLGFFLGILFMVWWVPRTRLINTIHATQQCTTVTVYEQDQDFCKEIKDDK